ncbi:uncharacterized protein LOC117121507 [Anneissia japonica]|uniref:uncharacterized protein LOC117121507 n=1 Tax=Anneissia japonica TaxID=1529436 RepID=UPI001425AF1B|nr:uncharacterized protein LOC117121507 [Anneissia japonica]
MESLKLKRTCFVFILLLVKFVHFATSASLSSDMTPGENVYEGGDVTFIYHFSDEPRSADQINLKFYDDRHPSGPLLEVTAPNYVSLNHITPPPDWTSYVDLGRDYFNAYIKKKAVVITDSGSYSLTDPGQIYVGSFGWELNVQPLPVCFRSNVDISFEENRKECSVIDDEKGTWYRNEIEQSNSEVIDDILSQLVVPGNNNVQYTCTAVINGAERSCIFGNGKYTIYDVLNMKDEL